MPLLLSNTLRGFVSCTTASSPLDPIYKYRGRVISTTFNFGDKTWKAAVPVVFAPFPSHSTRSDVQERVFHGCKKFEFGC